MKPSRPAYAWLADAVHPFDVICVSLVAVSALPVSSGCAAAVWVGLMSAITLALRHGSKERAAEVTRAFLVPPHAADDDP